MKFRTSLVVCIGLLLAAGSDPLFAAAKKAKKKKVGAGTNAAPLQLGFNVGWESLYGNSVSLHYALYPWLGLNGGIGYNQSGLKLGVGGEFHINLVPNWNWTSVLAAIYSQGKDGEVSINSEFTPLGGSSPEELVATKAYSVSPGAVLSVNSGVTWQLTPGLGFLGGFAYNLPVAGNKITLAETTAYDKNVEITNQNEFNKEFEDAANSKVTSGGLGAFIGVRLGL